MPEPEIIYEDKDRRLRLSRRSTCTPEFVEFLEGIVWGSGGVLYTMPRVADTLKRLKNPNFFSLTEDGRLVGVTTLNRKTVALGGETCPAFYSYGIAVHPGRRGQGHGTLIARERLRYALGQLGEKGLFYGFIEAGNINSIKTNTRAGSTAIGEYQALLISRLFPRGKVRFDKLDAAMKEEVVDLLKGQYAGHALLDVNRSVNADDYYLIRQGGDIAAGLQCAGHHLNIRHLPGLSGLLLVKVLPHLPGLSRLLPGGQLRFLTFGNLYVKDGREADLFALMETLLAEHHLHFGMIYLDRRSPVYQRLAKAGKFGSLHALVDVPVKVMGVFKGFPEGEIAAIHRQPLFISMDDPV